jgi:glycosyltransferase involved in cell wall biosynthesis
MTGSISIFFPCYNDSKSIGKLVENALSVARKLTKDYEIIVIDDGSTDKSRDVLKELSKRHKKVHLIFHESNQGYGGALKSGFQAASKDLVFYTDGDGQYNVKELPLLYSLMTPDVDFINGIKMGRSDTAYRIILGNFYSLVARWIFWLPIMDVDCDFRLIRKSILQKIHLTSNSGSICVELVKKSQRAGAKFRQVSVHHLQRRWGQSQFFVPSRLLSTFWELSNLWFRLILLYKISKSWK